MEFDLENILSTGQYAAILGPAVLAMAFGLALYRSRMSYPLLASFWQLTAGRRVIADQTIARYVQAQHDLASFTFFSHIRPSTVEDAVRLIEWSESNRIPLATIRSCGKHFDIGQLRIDEVTLPSRTRKISWLCILIACAIGVGIALGIAHDLNGGLMNFKDDGQRFIVTDEGIRSLDSLWRPWRHSDGLLNQHTCSTIADDAVVPGTAFSPEQTRLLCAAVGSDELNQMARQALRSQRILALCLGILSLGGLLTIVLKAERAKEARLLAVRLTQADTSPKCDSISPEPTPQD